MVIEYAQLVYLYSMQVSELGRIGTLLKWRKAQSISDSEYIALIFCKDSSSNGKILVRIALCKVLVYGMAEGNRKICSALENSSVIINQGGDQLKADI
jgi:hypothetical protein